jgi:hypothetical protein
MVAVTLSVTVAGTMTSPTRSGSAEPLLAWRNRSTKAFHIGPWIIVPILILIAIIGTPIYIVRDRRKRRSKQRTQ